MHNFSYFFHSLGGNAKYVLDVITFSGITILKKLLLLAFQISCQRIIFDLLVLEFGRSFAGLLAVPSLFTSMLALQLILLGQEVRLELDQCFLCDLGVTEDLARIDGCDRDLRRAGRCQGAHTEKTGDEWEYEILVFHLTFQSTK